MLSLFTQELRQIPYIRLVIPFAAGIIVQAQMNLLPPSEMSPALLLVFPLLIYIYGKNLAFKTRFWIGLMAFIGIFAAGAFHLAQNKTQIPEFPNKPIIVEGIITESLTEKPNSYQTVIKTIRIFEDSVQREFQSQIIAYIEKDSLTELNYGDKILFESQLSEVKNPGNPDEFDYKSYLLNKGISGQCYIQTASLIRTDTKQANPIIAAGLATRSKLSRTYKEYGIKGNEYAVLAALTLGDKSELEPDTRNAYAKAGAMHILAVSGLHVGIIYVVLNYLLGFLNKVSLKFIPGRLLKAILLIIGIWFFALLTGFSPSVLRASVMFSFVIGGNAIGRRINIYNSITASALFLLLYDPRLIMSVGFQLSYIAVLSIVYLQPRLQNLWTPSNKYIHKIWALTTVSVAAQIGTTPISFMYFHLFPNWFMLSNLIVIPLATLIVYAAALLLLTSFVPMLGSLSAFLLKFLVKFLNTSVEFVEQLPAAATENIPFQITDALISYLIIISFLVFLQYGKFRLLAVSISLTVIYTSMLLINDIRQTDRHKLMVYNVRNTSLIQFIEKNKALNITDSSLHENKNIDFAIGNYMLNAGIEHQLFQTASNDTFTNNEFFFRRNEFFICGNKTIAWLNKKEQSLYTSDKPLNVDCVILSGNEYFFMADIRHLFKPKIVVFDSSNKLNRIERWKEECDTLGMAWYSVPEQGAFEMNCK